MVGDLARADQHGHPGVEGFRHGVVLCGGGLGERRGTVAADGNGRRVRAYNPLIDVLCVCTGNVCRSPMLEVMLDDALRARGVDAHVHSAGVWEEGHPASPHSVHEAADRGLALGSHRSRLIDTDLVLGADLVIALGPASRP